MLLTIRGRNQNNRFNISIERTVFLNDQENKSNTFFKTHNFVALTALQELGFQQEYVFSC